MSQFKPNKSMITLNERIKITKQEREKIEAKLEQTLEKEKYKMLHK